MKENFKEDGDKITYQIKWINPIHSNEGMFKNIPLFYQKGRDVVPQLFKGDTHHIAHTTLNINSIYNNDHLQKVNGSLKVYDLVFI